jgi:hypothetical protein
LRIRRTRERNLESELRLSNLLAKLLNLEIGFCNVDRHKFDLDPAFQIEPQAQQWNRTTTSECNAIKMGAWCPRFSRRARYGDGRLKCLRAVARLPQDATLYCKDEVIDECLEAVASISLEVFGGRTKRRMRPLFNGIQIRGNRLEGVSQSSQIAAEFGIHGRHRKTPQINQLKVKHM